MVATCTRGMEEVLAAELSAAAIAAPAVERGAVSFNGGITELYRVCLRARSAVRLLLELAEGPARSRDELYRLAGSVAWERYTDPDRSLAVDVAGTSPYFKHTGFAGLVVKDAIVDRLRRVMGRRPDVDRTDPDIRVYVHLDPKRATVGLDAVGEPLGHRGYRPRGGPAPLSESLAAGILLTAGYDGTVPFVDPMCGTGTLAIEAALIATRTAPGLRREFACERWSFHDAGRLAAMRREAAGEIRPAPAPVRAFDVDPRAVSATRHNAAAAGVGEVLAVGRRALADLPELDPGTVVVTNPPYGHRLGEAAELGPLYRTLGHVLKHRAVGATAWLLAGERELLKEVGLRPARRIVVFNGPIECRLVRYDLFAGRGRRGERDAHREGER